MCVPGTTAVSFRPRGACWIGGRAACWGGSAGRCACLRRWGLSPRTVHDLTGGWLIACPGRTGFPAVGGRLHSKGKPNALGTPARLEDARARRCGLLPIGIKRNVAAPKPPIDGCSQNNPAIGPPEPSIQIEAASSSRLKPTGELGSPLEWTLAISRGLIPRRRRGVTGSISQDSSIGVWQAKAARSRLGGRRGRLVRAFPPAVAAHRDPSLDTQAVSPHTGAIGWFVHDSRAGRTVATMTATRGRVRSAGKRAGAPGSSEGAGWAGAAPGPEIRVVDGLRLV